MPRRHQEHEEHTKRKLCEPLCLRAFVAKKYKNVNGSAVEGQTKSKPVHTLATLFECKIIL